MYYRYQTVVLNFPTISLHEWASNVIQTVLQQHVHFINAVFTRGLYAADEQITN